MIPIWDIVGLTLRIYTLPKPHFRQSFVESSVLAVHVRFKLQCKRLAVSQFRQQCLIRLASAAYDDLLLALV